MIFEGFHIINFICVTLFFVDFSFFFFLVFFSLSGGKLSDLISLLPISQFIRTVFGMLYSNECRIVGGCFTAHKNSLVQVFYREFLTFPLYGY